MKIRVLIVDDHAVVRYGLRALLELSGMEVVGEAADGREALRLVQELVPDVAIMDVTMPGMNGIEATALLQARSPRTRVVMLSMHPDREHVHRAFIAGADGYLLKGAASEEIVAAVRAVQGGRRYVSRDLPFVDASGAGAGARGPLDSLSAREREVLQLVVEGNSGRGDPLRSSTSLAQVYVDTHRSRLMKKLGVSDVTALVKFAVQHGLTPSA